jgi:hypothetical protein
MYRGYTLVPVKEETKSRVKIFSGSTLLTRTPDYVDDESALIEAKEMVDGILKPVETPSNTVAQ